MKGAKALHKTGNMQGIYQTDSLHTLKFLNVLKFCGRNVKDAQNPRYSGGEDYRNSWNIWIIMFIGKKQDYCTIIPSS